VRAAFTAYFWSDVEGYFLRRIVPLDHERTAEQMADILAGRTPRANGVKPADLEFERDATLDASQYAIFAMDLLEVTDPRVEKTMQAIRQRLWIKSEVGGIARYERDHYHAVTDKWETVPGNPWFICTLWLADWLIEKATTTDELREALPILDWAARHALPSGILAEQVHPQTNAPLSVAPLTWSHATLVATVTEYLARHRHITTGQCDLPGQLRRQRASELVKEHEAQIAG